MNDFEWRWKLEKIKPKKNRPITRELIERAHRLESEFVEVTLLELIDYIKESYSSLDDHMLIRLLYCGHPLQIKGKRFVLPDEELDKLGIAKSKKIKEIA